MKKKYGARKFLVIVIVLAMILGPMAFARIKNIVAPPLNVALARQIEAYDDKIDVINIQGFDAEGEEWMAVLVELTDRQYWYPRRRENVVSFVLSLVREHDFKGLMISIVWENRTVSEILQCEGTRESDCSEWIPVQVKVRQDFWIWEGRGKP